jgi:hypothetical protein
MQRPEVSAALNSVTVDSTGDKKDRYAVNGVNPVAKAISAGAALNSVTVDSTGDTKDRFGDWNNGGPKTYTLTVRSVCTCMRARK